jgi:hypothetical protein
VIEQSDGIVISRGLQYGPLFTDCATRNNTSFVRATLYSTTPYHASPHIQHHTVRCIHHCRMQITVTTASQYLTPTYMHCTALLSNTHQRQLTERHAEGDAAVAPAGGRVSSLVVHSGLQHSQQVLLDHLRKGRRAIYQQQSYRGDNKWR